MMQGSYSFDLHRIFLGDLPLLFFVEIALRTTILYVWTLIMLRLTGKRSMSKLTALELLLVIGLGSAVGDSMFYPNVPVLHGMAVIGFVIALHELTLKTTNRFKGLHDFVVGTPARVVVDGILDLEGMEQSQMSREELFMSLRQEKLMHLGQLQRVYIEPDGKFSTYQYDQSDVRPGLPIMPPEEFEIFALYAAGQEAPKTGEYVCDNCGWTKAHEVHETFGLCPRCGHGNWAMASIKDVNA